MVEDSSEKATTSSSSSAAPPSPSPSPKPPGEGSGLFAGLSLASRIDDADADETDQTPKLSNTRIQRHSVLEAPALPDAMVHHANSAASEEELHVVPHPSTPPASAKTPAEGVGDKLLGRLELAEAKSLKTTDAAVAAAVKVSEVAAPEDSGASAGVGTEPSGDVGTGAGSLRLDSDAEADGRKPTADKEAQGPASPRSPTDSLAAATNAPSAASGPKESSGGDGDGDGKPSPKGDEPEQKEKMNEEEKKALDDAFRHNSGSSPPPTSRKTPPPTSPAAAAAERPKRAPAGGGGGSRPRPRGLGEVHPETPIPNSDVAMRLLRKFAYKTRPKITTSYGGSKSRGLFSFLFGAGRDDPHFVPYRDLMDTLYEEGEDPDEILSDDSSERVVEAVLGGDRDSMARARVSMSAFAEVFSVWGHASSDFFERKDVRSQQAFSELLSASLDAATQLVVHGCLDGVKIGIRTLDGPWEHQSVVCLLAQSVFSADLTVERNELAALKFLLSTGCRVTPDGHGALLRGTHLLQSIRTFYHIYLTTESTANKTTARAALQQLVTSVFARVVKTDVEDRFRRTPDNFPSDNHRDAFLVLRSICKLSMRNLPDPNTGLHSHVGLQSSASNDMWDGNRDAAARGSTGAPRDAAAAAHQENASAAAHREHAQLVYTSAIHPALESKILALELLLYVLQSTDFSRGFIMRSGSQFHAAIRNYLCVSLLKNCTSDTTRVVNLSLRIFVPLVRNFRTILKSEIEAFVTNVFFVILDSRNSPAEHKSLVVRTFEEICSEPTTLAEIFLNYDCDLSAVDLFHRIVNSLSKISRVGVQEPRNSGGGLSFMGGPSAARMERFRNENRELRLDAMRALRQVLASLHASIVEPMSTDSERGGASVPFAPFLDPKTPEVSHDDSGELVPPSPPPSGGSSGEAGKHRLVEIYDSKKRRRAEESEAILRFNQKPSAGIAYAVKCGHVHADDPADVARYLLQNKDAFDKTQIGEYLGREAEYQNGFSLKVLHEYVQMMDLKGLLFDDAIRFFLSGFRLPGEAQKIDRIMEKFAERYTEQNPDVFPSADVAFILAFSIIMLNTDLHNPAIKEERRMTREGFIRNNRGICDGGQDLPEELLTSIFDRIQANPISLKEDDEARERAGESSKGSTGLPAALSPASFFTSHYDEMDRARETNFQKEREHIVRTTESLLKRRRHSTEVGGRPASKSRPGKSPRHPRFVRTEDSGLCDEYVSPMFEVAWGPALAAFSTAMESANGTVGALIAIASDEELELAAENAAETIEVCLTGFRFAICTAGLCGNDTARDAYMLALSRFSQLGTGVLLEPRHVRCIQTLLSLAREDGELLGTSWGHVFKALSEINRFHQLFHLMARNDRAAATAAERRRRRLEEKEQRRRQREERRAAAEDGETIDDAPEDDDAFTDDEDEDSLAESGLFSDEDEFAFDEEMDAKGIDEANARLVYDAVSEATIEAIYERSSSLSAPAVKVFVTQLCFVSRMEISVGGIAGSSSEQGAGSREQTDLTQVSYRQQHELLTSSGQPGGGGDQFHHSQPNIYNLQKLVEVTHYNMDSRPRLIFAELWSIVASHLTGTALHSNPALAMYAVDSFRQLSFQYLQREELEVFEFQKRFLKPLETVMARSTQPSTKELLLNCVDRIIHVFGADASSSDTAQERKGGLRSGWVPILTILGLGGRDANFNIARMSFKTLTGEITQCREDTSRSGVLLSEHFVVTVNALLMFVSGPHDEISVLAIDQLVSLTDFLADDAIAPPHLRRRATPGAAASSSGDDGAAAASKQELEHWWPILLGLSRSVGDPRMELRSKGLEALLGIINKHFFPSSENQVAKIPDRGGQDDIQTLQLIFRGILTPILEFAEIGSQDGQVPSLPEDFDRFLSHSPPSKATAEEAVEEMLYTGWLETTFDPFMDACVSVCLRSIGAFKDDSLVEEIFAILNSCLLSDSGSLAVRGLLRLEQFVTSDLDPQVVTDDVWATTSHMLRRCMSMRGLPAKPSLSSSLNGTGGAMGKSLEEISAQQEREYNEAVMEFIAEDMILSDRRYVGSCAVMVVGLLLSSDRFSQTIGLRWRLFLVAGVGRAILQWEQAASLLAANPEYLHRRKPEVSTTRPPDYRETAVYGRKWLNRFLLQLASMKEIVQTPPDAEIKGNRFAAGQKLVVDETQRLLTAFLEMERVATQYRHSADDEALYMRFTALVSELLSGYNNMDAEHLRQMSWINPILLSSAIQSKNEDIRLSVQKLVQRTTPVNPSSPYPTPARPEKKASPNPSASETAPDEAEKAAAPKGVPQHSAKAAPAGKAPAKKPEKVQTVIDAVLSLEPQNAEPQDPRESEVEAPENGVDKSSEVTGGRLLSVPSDEEHDLSEPPVIPQKAVSSEPLNGDSGAGTNTRVEQLDAQENREQESSWNPMSWFGGQEPGDTDGNPTEPNGNEKADQRRLEGSRKPVASSSLAVEAVESEASMDSNDVNILSEGDRKD